MPKMKEENFISSPPKSEPNCSELFFIPTSHSEFRIQNSLEGARPYILRLEYFLKLKTADNGRNS